MQDRIKDIIKYTTKGKNAEFARLLGWTPQYLNGIINHEGGIGLQPVLTILQKCPDVDARWLLLGEGTMLRPTIIERTRIKLAKLIELDKYVPVMSTDELLRYCNGDTDFGADNLAAWEKKLQNHCIKKQTSL